jgi:hypothetical protein
MTSQEACRTEPRTAAGKRLVEQLRRLPPAWGHLDAILAIEEEAAALDTHSGDDHDCKDSFTVPEQDVPASWSKR